MATAARRLLTVEGFLALEFTGDEGRRVELSNGTIRLMAGGSVAHARVQQNISGSLFVALRGSLFSPFGPDMGVRTHDLSLRYPDVSVFCGRDDPEFDKLLECDDPKLVVEVLSPSTKREDISIKLPEYQAIASLDAILYVDPDPDAETIRLLTRTSSRGWSDESVEEGNDIMLEGLGVALAWNDVFRRK